MGDVNQCLDDSSQLRLILQGRRIIGLDHWLIISCVLFRKNYGLKNWIIGYPKMEVWKMMLSMFLFNWVIFRFQLLIFQVVYSPLKMYVFSSDTFPETNSLHLKNGGWLGDDPFLLGFWGEVLVSGRVYLYMFCAGSFF